MGGSYYCIATFAEDDRMPFVNSTTLAVPCQSFRCVIWLEAGIFISLEPTALKRIKLLSAAPLGHSSFCLPKLQGT